MALSVSTARKLCTKAELELVLDSAAKAIGELSAAELRARIRRARTLRDKYVTLASRQRRVARGKQEKRGLRPSKSNDNTVRKQQIFDEVLGRFEARLQKIEGKSSAAPAAKRRGKGTARVNAEGNGQSRAVNGRASEAPAATPSAPTPRPRSMPPRRPVNALLSAVGGKPIERVSSGGTIAARNTSLGVRSKASKGKRIIRTKQQVNQPAILGHISARGRRDQAKRDSK